MRRRLSWTILGFGALALAACNGGGSVGGNSGGSAGSTGTGTGTVDLPKVDKVDIVLGIDNSRSMADKQEILSLALSDLVNSLSNPPCVNTKDEMVGQPASPSAACPSGSRRRFAPINDIHVGVITTSLGGHGGDACPATETSSCPGGAPNTSNDDKGHLVTRLDPCGTGSVPTYGNKGFLAWDPKQKDNPPGESDPSAFTAGIRDLVIGAGQSGCGYEAQLESWYRFLVEPEPYDSISVNPTTFKAQPSGIDATLLQERKDFLRPDSLLAILMLSDEDDCSIKDFDYGYLASSLNSPFQPGKAFQMFKARSECATNPNDHCCFSCGVPGPADCAPEPGCDSTAVLDPKDDDTNLRCWDQKRRFGMDLLYPIDRYVNGLTAAKVPNRAGDLVDNPIFSNLDPDTYPNAKVRDSGLVVLSGIVGVPWQDLARDPTDLTKGYKTAEELAHATNGHTTWDVILGDPSTRVQPLDPHMIESPAPRTGTDPITGTTLAPPSQTAGGSDAINGHEYTPGTKNGVQIAPDDLQFACIFPLQQPRDCSTAQGGCDCVDPQNDNPLCADNNGNGRTLQVNAKAYPGLRQLNVLRDLGPQGVAASICPAQITDQTRADYAYRPAIQALITRVGSRLKGL